MRCAQSTPAMHANACDRVKKRLAGHSLDAQTLVGTFTYLTDAMRAVTASQFTGLVRCDQETRRAP